MTEQMDDKDLFIKAHSHSSRHKDEIEKSSECVCFYCKHRFAPKDIVEWHEEKRVQKCLNLPQAPFTALCPRCGIDSVIGSASGIELTDSFIDAMNKYWFDRSFMKNENETT